VPPLQGIGNHLDLWPKLGYETVDARHQSTEVDRSEAGQRSPGVGNVGPPALGVLWIEGVDAAVPGLGKRPGQADERSCKRVVSVIPLGINLAPDLAVTRIVDFTEAPRPAAHEGRHQMAPFMVGREAPLIEIGRHLPDFDDVVGGNCDRQRPAHEVHEQPYPLVAVPAHNGSGVPAQRP
jgi:hypothetical protein